MGAQNIPRSVWDGEPGGQGAALQGRRGVPEDQHPLRRGELWLVEVGSRDRRLTSDWPRTPSSSGTRASWRTAPRGSWVRRCLLRSTASASRAATRRSSAHTSSGELWLADTGHVTRCSPLIGPGHLTQTRTGQSTSRSSCWLLTWPPAGRPRRSSTGLSGEASFSTHLRQ